MEKTASKRESLVAIFPVVNAKFNSDVNKNPRLPTFGSMGKIQMGKYFFFKTLLLSFSNERMHDIDTRWFSGEILSTSFDAVFFFLTPQLIIKTTLWLKNLIYL